MILSELKEIEVGPAGVFCIEVLLAPVFEAQAMVVPALVHRDSNGTDDGALLLI